MNANYSLYIQEIKENCPPLKNIQLSCKKPFPQMIDSMTQKIPLIKKNSIHKICSQQEQKIYQNIHKLKKFSLLKEIGKVNPHLHNELRQTKSDQLQEKLVEYQKLKQLHSDIIIEHQLQESTNNDNDGFQPYDILCSGVKLLRKPFVRNIMDDYDGGYSDYSDSYVNKYLDLN